MTRMPKCKQCGRERRINEETWETKDYCSEECMDQAFIEGKIQ